MFEPQGITLYSYQREGIERAAHKSGIYLYWDCGTGKTIAGAVSALSAKTILGDHHLLNYPIVVVTRATVKYQWKREIERLAPDASVFVLNGFSPEEETSSHYDFFIMNWDILAERQEEFIKQHPRFLLIMDELHYAKGWKRHEKVYDPDLDRTVKQVAENRLGAIFKLARQAVWRVGLSATPMDFIRDLWAQFDLLTPDLLGNNWTYIHRYCNACPGEYGGMDTTGSSRLPELKRRLKPYIHRVTKDQAKKELPKIRRELVKLDRTQQCKAVGFTQELRQNKSSTTSMWETRLAMATARKRTWTVAEAVALALEGQKVVVFTGRRKENRKLGEAIAKKLKKHSDIPTWCMNGEDSHKARGNAAAAYFNHTGGCVFIGTTQAFGESIDGFQCSDVALITMLPWTPRLVQQLEGRFPRMGGDASKTIRIVYVIAEGTIDMGIADTILSRLEVVANMFEGDDVKRLVSMFSGEDSKEKIIRDLLAEYL